MSLQNLNFGTAAPNDGEFLPTAFAKIQANFAEIYGVFGNGTVLSPAPPFALVVGASQGLGSIAVPASGTVLQGVAGANPAWTATPTLGVAGTTLGTLAFAGNTSGTTTLQPAAAASGILTLPAATTTDTLVARNTTDTLQNKTLVAPVLGVATATSINGLTISTTTGTLTIANAKTLVFNNSLTFAGTDGTTITFGGASSSFPIVTSPSAAILQLGAPDAASPVAQILQTQSVSAGTINTTGPDFTINLAKSTGQNDGGRLAISATPGGASGSAVNAQATAFLTVDQANVLSLANAGNPCEFRIYNTRDPVGTKLTNFEILRLYGTVGSDYFVQAFASGTGSQNRSIHLLSGGGGSVQLGNGGSDRWRVDGNSGGHFLAVTDNINDIGASLANRPRNLFLAGGVTHGSATLLTTTTALTNNAAAQTATLTNGPTAGNPTKWIPINDNGTTRNIPAW